MQFKDPSIIPDLARLIKLTLELPPSSPGMKIYRDKVVTCMCRELEKLIHVRRSVAAQAEAEKLGIGDLRNFGWADQNRKKKMGDQKREVFHFEHMVPVKMLTKDLFALKDPSLSEIEMIISKAVVAWITKKENRELDRLKLRHDRPDSERAYQKAGIVLCKD